MRSACWLRGEAELWLRGTARLTGAANVLRVQTLQTIHTAKDVSGVPVDGSGAGWTRWNQW